MKIRRLTIGLILLSCMPFAVAQDETGADAQTAAAQQQAEQTPDAITQANTAAQKTTEEVQATAKQAAAEEVQAAARQAAAERDKNATALQTQLDAQAAMIASQSATNRQLNKELNAMQSTVKQQQDTISAQEAQLQSTAEVLNNMQSQIDQIRTDKGQQLSDEDVAMRQRLKKLESQVSTIPTDPSTLLADATFPGAIRVPGTTASFKFGGFVKGTLAKNFAPLLTQDRFIPGSIPVTSTDETALASEASLTANQSRLNFDYRQRSDVGTVRAFIEADFAGSGDTFRLRHAFGQFQDLLIGKTWSAFFDAEASPEEVDFEGINGRVVVRQTQVRYFPQIGKNVRWMISLEDPAPQVTNGSGISDFPDVVTSIRREWFKRYHVKTALLLRQIRALVNQGYDENNGQACDPASPQATLTCVAIPQAGSTQKDFGWAITVSGKMPLQFFGEADNLMFQLNYGQGIGRYLTDLSSVNGLGIDGGQDGVIDPTTGQLRALTALGGYLSYQHWWRKKLRSTFLVSIVDVDNLPSQFDTAYHRTTRVSGNLIWSPIPIIDIGGEVLWGKRTNNSTYTTGTLADGTRSGNATQFQLEGVYRF